MSKRKDLSTALLGVIMALILWATILSRETLLGAAVSYCPFHSFVSFMREIQSGRIGANFYGNIILFIPVGVLLPVVTDWKKMWKATTAVIGFSLFIEIIQLVTSRGCFDLDDVLLNALGGVFGFWLNRMISKRLAKKDMNAGCI